MLAPPRPFGAIVAAAANVVVVVVVELVALVALVALVTVVTVVFGGGGRGGSASLRVRARADKQKSAEKHDGPRSAAQISLTRVDWCWPQTKHDD